MRRTRAVKTQLLPRLTKNQATQIAERALREHNWVYDADYGLRPIWRGFCTDIIGQSGAALGLWSVNFLTPPSPFDQESRFVEISDETGAALGVMTAHNYFQFE